MDCLDERQRVEAWENGRCERITHAWNERDAEVVVVVVMVKKSLSCCPHAHQPPPLQNTQRTSNANQPELKLTFIQLLA